jgi:tricorn protease-like protein
MKYLIVVLMLVLMAVAIRIFADTRILFSSNRDGDRYSLFVMNPDGSNLSNLGSGNKPKWSPDGTKIGFDRARDNTWQFDAFIMNADGSGRVKLADLPGSKGFLSWSPVRQRLLFSGLRIPTFSGASMS